MLNCCAASAPPRCAPPDPDPHPQRPPHPDPRQEQYASWYPEDVTFQPKLVSSQRVPGAAGAPGERPAGGPAALAERLYASYEKVRRIAEPAGV